MNRLSHYIPLLGGVVVLVLAAGSLTYITSMSAANQTPRGLVSGTAITPSPTPTTTATPTPTPTATPKVSATPAAGPAKINRFGVSMGNTLPWLPPAELGHRLDDLKSLGIGWVRLDLDWNNVQHDGPGSYSWSSFDAVVAAANARGLSLLPIITYTAPWARSSACAALPTCAPANPADFAKFAAAAVSHYQSQGIHHWEIWNEPNMAGFWAPAANANAYANLLRATYPAIKKADPSATVISGGLSSTAAENGNIPQLDYFAALYAAGAGGNFDAVGYHPYSYPVPPAYGAPWNAWSKMDATTVSLRSLMAAHGDGAKLIWITEYGAPTNGPGVGSTGADYKLDQGPDHVDEAFQAVLATEFVRTAAATPWLGPAFWYSYKDGGTNTDTVENFFGLIRADGTHKPAYAAYQAAVLSHP